ncbi:hypothetical protein C8Q78DRAFT_4517 [Trametes maxima]|nr:hypothetical protein C8Q78DRAFT_4517 [Trametes maxima]
MSKLSRASIYSLSKENTALVCSYLTRDNGYPGSSGSLFALALTCRFLSGPALDAMWQALPYLDPLLLTLPKDLLTFIKLPESLGTLISSCYYRMTFSREPVPGDFTRLVGYASRVRSFGKDYYVRSTRMFEIAPEVWEMLQRHCPAPLFPNLKRLAYCCFPVPGDPPSSDFGEDYPRSITQTSRWARLMLGSRLEDIALGLSHVSEVVEHLSIAAPDIKVISLSEDCRELRGGLIGRFTGLLEFSTNALLPGNALRELGSLPLLRSLELCPNKLIPKSERPWDGPPCSGVPREWFPALKRVKIDALKLFDDVQMLLTWYIAFFVAITSPFLEDVMVELCLAPARDDPPAWGRSIQQLCDTLTGHRSRHRIRSLCIALRAHEYVEEVLPSAAAYLPPACIALLPLRALQRLTLEGGCYQMLVDDALLHSISIAWPDIRVIIISDGLSMPSYRDSYAPPGHMNPSYDITLDSDDEPDHALDDHRVPKATLAGLIPIARGCKKLEEFQIPMDMRVVPVSRNCRLGQSPLSLDPLIEDGRPPVELRSLVGSLPGDPGMVASFLTLLFPRLLVKNTYLGMGPDRRWLWMLRFCEMFLLTRRQERQWALRNSRRSFRGYEPDLHAALQD